jgi:argininosuccinate lyase-like protein
LTGLGEREKFLSSKPGDRKVGGLRLFRRVWRNGARRRGAMLVPRLLLATDAAEALVSEGVPFRDAHEQVAAAVRAGTFEPPRSAPRLGDVAAAVAAAKARWSAARDRQARS